MKSIVNILILAASLVLTSVASATFVVTPTISEDLYACNAGISHPKPSGDLCMFQDTNQACSKASCNGDSNCETRCVCYSDVVAGDRFSVNYEDLLMPESSGARFRGAMKSVQGNGSNFNTLFNTSEIWTKKITSLHFDFSSERYGTKYFVDFCYLGPIESIIPGTTPAVDASWGAYRLGGSISISQLLGSNGYYQSSGLKGQMSYDCDLRENGSQIYPRGSSEITPGGSLEVDTSYASSLTSFTSSALYYDSPINTYIKAVPRFCRLRVYLQETLISKPRDLQNANSEMTVDLAITK